MKAVEFDYTNQAWLEDGRYVRCGHPASMACRCYGTLHEGERREDSMVRLTGVIGRRPNGVDEAGAVWIRFVGFGDLCRMKPHHTGGYPQPDGFCTICGKSIEEAGWMCLDGREVCEEHVMVRDEAGLVYERYQP